MPWTKKQNKLFQLAATDPSVAKKHGLTQTKARQLASEGVKQKGKKRPT